MLIAVQNKPAIDEISPALTQELDRAFATISQTFTQEHTEQGSHTVVGQSTVALSSRVDALEAQLASDVTILQTQITTNAADIVTTAALIAVKKVTVTLTDAQVKGLNTTPVQMLAAQGAGNIIIPVMWTVQKDAAAGAYSASPNLRLRWAGLATDIVTVLTPVLNSTTAFWGFAAGTLTGGVSSNPANLALQVSSTADVTGGNAANSLKVTVFYGIFAGI